MPAKRKPVIETVSFIVNGLILGTCQKCDQDDEYPAAFDFKPNELATQLFPPDLITVCNDLHSQIEYAEGEYSDYMLYIDLGQKHKPLIGVRLDGDHTFSCAVKPSYDSTELYDSDDDDDDDGTEHFWSQFELQKKVWQQLGVTVK